jgi:hypothetical protein
MTFNPNKFLLPSDYDPIKDQNQIIKVPGSGVVERKYGRDLRALRQYHPDLLIIGGAVRDSLFGREVKDVDHITTSSLTVQALVPLWNLKNISDPTYEDTDMVFQNEDKSKDLLFVTDLWHRVACFPDSISQCWFDGTNVYGTTEFMKTYMTEIVTYASNIKAERLGRLKAKYPEFTFQSNDFF